ncbi:hypothetical protein [Microvirga antarctica]|uniref:hypothetical protein n=1 Tax=Microvirga antarctica TaxID=2819233 RepID=UPI001B3018A1|nr:hypothetical protein [Microvirga antarctica]
MVDGRDYQQSFEDALTDLTGRLLDRDDALGQLVSLEFTLWEAIRGAMIVTGNLAALVILAPISYLAWLSGSGGWVVGAAFLAAWLLITVGLYWLFKFAVHYEIGRHAKGRRFGDFDLPWLPGGTGYREEETRD